MSQPNGLTDSISQVLKLGGRYSSWASVEREFGEVAASQAAQGIKTNILEKMLEAQGRRFEARADLLKIIPPLAVQLEDAGIDTSVLRLLLLRIDAGGGPAAAEKGWEDLKVELQMMLLTPPQQSSGVEHRPLYPPADLARMYGLTDQVDAVRKRLGRWRKANLDGGWLEATDRKPKEPQFFYPLIEPVRKILEKMSGSTPP